MNPVTTALTLNLQLPNIAAVAWAVQGDMGSRQIRATLVDGGSSWTPQAGYHGVIRYFKPDGTTGVYDVDEGGTTAVTWSGNIATIKIAQQALTVPGTVIMQLEFYDSNDARVSTFGWAMNVQPSAVTDTEFLSTDYYSILTLQIAGVLGATGNPPYINSTSKNWMIWDENANAYVDSGYSSIGTTGPSPTLTNTSHQYANSSSGTTVPSSWSNTRPTPVAGTWAWTKTVLTFGTSGTTTYYTCAYQGNDGIGAPGTATPLMDGVAAVGTANAYAHEDHVHPYDTGMFDRIYPVGSIYMSVNSTSPATLFGGTWEQITDKFLLSAGSTYTAGSTGGSATKNLQHNHTTSNHTLTTAEIPAHSHDRQWYLSQTGYSYTIPAGVHYVKATSGNGLPDNFDYASTELTGRNRMLPINTGNTGGGGGHNHGNTDNKLSETQDIMPPYLTVYMWKRTA